MTQRDLPELRRIVGAVAQLEGETVRDVTVRSDLRHIKVEFASGIMLLIAVGQDELGRPRCEVDVVAAPQDAEAKHQIEVRFD